MGHSVQRCRGLCSCSPGVSYITGLVCLWPSRCWMLLLSAHAQGYVQASWQILSVAGACGQCLSCVSLDTVLLTVIFLRPACVSHTLLLPVAVSPHCLFLAPWAGATSFILLSVLGPGLSSVLWCDLLGFLRGFCVFSDTLFPAG